MTTRPGELIDHIGLLQDLEDLLGVGVDVVARSALKTPGRSHSRRGRGSVTRRATPEIPRREVKGMRMIAAHAYHRIDYDEVWVTLRDDVPRLDQAIKHWRQAQA